MAKNLFEYATRNKLRFSSSKGELNIEQLWDVPLRSTDGFNLNAIAKNVNKAMKDAAEDNYVDSVKTPSHSKLELMFETVKFVIDTKLEEEAASKRRAENKKEREMLLEALAEKQKGELSEMSVSALKKRIEALKEKE